MKQQINVVKKQRLKLTIGLLVLGVLCSYALVSFVYETYKSKRLARLVSCSPLAVPPLSIARSKDIVLIGDSRIQAWGRPKLSDKGMVFNEGIGGETTSELLCRLGHILSKHKPQYFILQTGINDLVAVSMLKEPQREQAEHQVFNNIQRIIEQLSQSGAKVLYLDIVPPIKPDVIRSIVWGANIDGSVQKLNNLVRSSNISSKYDTGHFEMTEVFLNTETHSWRDEYALDTLHWTSDAYTHLTRAISKQIQ